MARINLKSGDSGDLPVTFQGDTLQQALTLNTAGVLTLSTTDCHVYVFDSTIGREVVKIVNGQPPRSFNVAAHELYDVTVAGTTDARPSGVIHYSFV